MPEAGSRGFVLPRFMRRPVRHASRFLREGQYFTFRRVILVTLSVTAIAATMTLYKKDAGELLLARASILAGFRIGDIDVSGGREVTKIDVLANIDLGADRPFFTFDVYEAREDLKKLPWIHDARVSKTYPDRLSITLVEHEPFAIWQRGRELQLIERGGQEIVPFERRFAGLPLVVGPGANLAAAEIIALGKRYETVGNKIKAFVRVGMRRWNLVLENGVVIMLPAENTEAALHALSILQRDAAIFDRDILKVDMRLDDRLVLQLTPDGQKSVEDAQAAKMELVKSGEGAI
jgi:cell division protein FtsQ